MVQKFLDEIRGLNGGSSAAPGAPPTSTPAPTPAPTPSSGGVRALLDEIAGIEGFDQAVEEVRGSRQIPTAEPAPSPSENPFDVDKILKEGTQEERKALADRYASWPKEPIGLDNEIAKTMGLQLPGWDERIQELGEEIPRVEKKAGGFLGFMGEVVDVVGQTLSAPAEGIERVIGMAYWNEVPLADRWKMSAWTYDSIWYDVFNGGAGRSAAMEDYEAGKSWEEIETENQHVLGNTIAQLVLDPLWLVGGVPMLGRAPGVVGAVGRGVNFSKVPLARNVPVLRNMGRPVADRILEDSLAIRDDIGRASEQFNASRQNGGLRRLWERTPQAHVDTAHGHITNVTSALSDPAVWETGQVRQMFASLGSGRPARGDLLGLEGTTPVKNMRKLFEQNPELGATIQRFESLNPITFNRFWDDAPHVLGFDPRPGMLTRKLTPDEYSKLGAYHAVKFGEEFAQKGIPALYDVYKMPKKDLVAHMESASGAMKTALAMVTLNTPSFVVMNFVNNLTSFVTKLDDPAAGLNFATRGWSSRRTQTMTEMGFTPELIDVAAADSAFKLEVTGVDDIAKQPSSVRKWTNRMLPFVSLTQKVDQGMRKGSFESGALTAAAAVWKRGDGGVLPEIPQSLRSVPLVQSWAEGLKGQGFGALQELRIHADSLHTDELLSADSLAVDWVKEFGPKQYAEAAQTAGDNLNDLFRQMEIALPEWATANVQDYVTNARTARHSGDPDYLKGLDETVDEWHDKLSLEVADQRLLDRLPWDPLPYHTAKPQAAGWMDAAEFSRMQRDRREMASRLIAANNPSFGGERLALGAQTKVDEAMQGYEKAVRELFDTAPKTLDATTLKQVYGRQRELLLARNEQIAQVMRRRTRKVWDQVAEAEVQMLDEALQARLTSVDSLAGLGPAEAQQAWAQAIRGVHETEVTSQEKLWQALKLEHAPQFLQPEYLTQADLLSSQATDAHDYFDYVRKTLPEQFRKSTVLSGKQVEDMQALVPQLEVAMRERNLVAMHHGRAIRDMVSINYAQKRGFDGALAMVFPYHYWIGRTARDWMKLTQARPGQTMAMAKLFTGIRDINEDAGIPDRLKGNIRIPVPFGLDDKIFGGPASMYFDPLRLLYPLSGFQAAASGEGRESDASTRAGQMFEFASNLGLGINPFATLGLGAMGALGDRHAYVQRGLASVNALPFGIPGPRVFRSASDWFAGINEDPDPEYLTDEIKQLLANGEPLPEDVLKEAFQEIADYATTDGFDGYRTDRMVASLVGSDPQRWSPRAGLEALRYQRGPLWQEAVRQSKKEKGLRVLTGWGLMPMQVYPEGEQTMRGLDAIFGEVAHSGDPQQMDDFFKQHPEYQVRRMSQKDRENGEQLAELDTSLFFMDFAKVEEKFDPLLDALRGNVQRMEELGYLETKDGRRLREVVANDIKHLTDLKQEQISQLEALYPHRAKELTTKASPHERGLFAMRQEYFDIQRKDFKTDDEFYAARAGFINSIPEEGADPGEWMEAAVDAVVIWNQASEEMARNPRMAREIEAKRDEQLRSLTDSTKTSISRDDFEQYISGSRRAPTQAKIEFDKAKDEIAMYYAIEQVPDLTEASKKQMKRAFWQEHPLLEKYFGSQEPKPWNLESAYTYGRMNEIWDGYYAVDGDARAQRDYLSLNLEELNELRLGVGLYPIKLSTFNGKTFTDMPDGALQRPGATATGGMAFQ